MNIFNIEHNSISNYNILTMIQWCVLFLLKVKGTLFKDVFFTSSCFPRFNICACSLWPELHVTWPALTLCIQGMFLHYILSVVAPSNYFSKLSPYILSPATLDVIKGIIHQTSLRNWSPWAAKDVNMNHSH